MNKQTTQFYNKFSIFYPLLDLFLKPHKRKLFKEINKLKSGKLLEIGVGDGAHFHLYENHEITGIDTSEKMLERARSKKCERVEIYNMSGEDLLFPADTFDYIVLCHVISVVDDPEKLLSECNRVLKENGKIIILNHFTPNNWLKYFDESFQVVSNFFKFKSLFYIKKLKMLSKFSLDTEIDLNRFSYFKILIYSK